MKLDRMGILAVSLPGDRILDKAQDMAQRLSLSVAGFAWRLSRVNSRL